MEVPLDVQIEVKLAFSTIGVVKLAGGGTVNEEELFTAQALSRIGELILPEL